MLNNRHHKTFIFRSKNGNMLCNMDTVAIDTKIETYIKCKKCGAEVYTITRGNLTPCRCGAISVDGSNDLMRIIGNPEDYEEIQK